jgi:sugar phosphate isomerase/epimerase
MSNKLLKASLLSSFSPNFTQISHWPNDIEYVELYALMRPDLELVVEDPITIKVDNQLTALRAMADCRFHGSSANKIHQFLGKTRAGNQRKLVAISSFIAELSAPECYESDWKGAQNALMSIVKIALELRKLGHPVHVVELVAGSSIDGVTVAKPMESEQKSFLLKRRAKSVATMTLIERLQPIAELALSGDKPLYLALEMEPGPLFTIGSFDDIVKFAAALDNIAGTPAGRVVGFNLDIPHWAFLAGTQAGQVMSQPSVFKRILHAHICDHGKGHYGDAELGLIHSKKDFDPWLDLLRQRSSQSESGALPFSKFVTLEMECAKSIQSVERSLTTLDDWL